MRHIGNAGQQFAELFLEGLDVGIQRGHLLLHATHLLLAGGGVFALAAQFADFGAFGVHRGLQLLGAGNGRAALLVEVAETFQSSDGSTRGKAFGDALEIGPERLQIVHFPPC